MSSARPITPPSKYRPPSMNFGGAVANDGGGVPAQVRHHHLAGLPVAHLAVAVRLQHLDHEVRFKHPQSAGRVGGLERHRADLAQPVVVEQAGAPGDLNSLAGGRDTAARLSGHDHGSYVRGRQVDPLCRRGFGQV
jgi:hypothetical protein